ncbi:hypothetical protein ACSCB1_19360 [Streptomyces europaeiscabiei]|uniref:hypothetical protein n=1 Tax=Streptomyces europaeiscabiei TaxID=146819 RepID=UPI0006285649|nr:hypothetical protein [Streptomyces europaeiscabiei]MDX2522974.1 hypothetical protein [Streptomyces europaeiscabiei]MDX2773304.1 hypothetical protein [Streptomyces europaeiscabiei]
MGMKSQLALNATVGLLLIGVVTTSAGSGDTTVNGRGAADHFKAFVNTHGTSADRAAVSHVTEVHRPAPPAGDTDATDVHTDFTGGPPGGGTGPARLISAAFADWKHDERGRVTVHDSADEVLDTRTY